MGTVLRAEDIPLLTELKVGRPNENKAAAIFRCDTDYRGTGPWLDFGVYVREMTPPSLPKRKRGRGGDGNRDGGNGGSGGGGGGGGERRRFLGQIRAMFHGPDGEQALLLMQTYVGDTQASRQLPHDVLAWHPITRLGQALTVVAATELCDTAFVFPALQSDTPLPLPREGVSEVFWVPRELYFPVHAYPAKVAEEGEPVG